MSTSWRGDATGAQAYRDAIGPTCRTSSTRSTSSRRPTLTLSGRSGTIPVTVKNELGQPVNLVLRLTSSANIRLEIKNADQPITIEGGHTSTLKFQTNGQRQRHGQDQGRSCTPRTSRCTGTPSPSTSTSTRSPTSVMLIIGAGLLLLVLAGVRIYRQRKRLAADGGGEDDDDGDDEETDGDGPEQPGDPAADTGQENTEPSPTGEKVDG